MNNIDNKIVNSAKWSLITEVLAKIISPITNMILVRILSPSAFGILATVQMIISFADMLSDAGIQKYIVQKEFPSEDEQKKTIQVAMYTNLALSLFLWIVIFFTRDEIAYVVGNPGLGDVLAIAGLNIPLIAFTSVQLAVLRRNFEFKKILKFRMVNIFTPLLVTIPLALYGCDYWSLIIGYITGQLCQTICIIYDTNVKFIKFYSFKYLRQMLSFSIWTLFESLIIWLTAWCDIFLVAHTLPIHYLGIYKMSMVSVQSILAVVSSAILPVLYSALSRLQNNVEAFKMTFFRANRKTAFFIIPIGFSMLVYSDLFRKILFGDKWVEADLMIGLWGCTSCLLIVYGHFCSEVYRSCGRPKISTIAQLLHIVILIPLIFVFSEDFIKLVWVRNLIRFQSIVVDFYFLKYFFNIDPIKMLRNTWRYLLASSLVSIFVYVTRRYFESVLYDYFSIVLSFLAYLFVICLFTEERNLLKQIYRERSIL